MSDQDRLIGKNLARIRGETTQQDLAARMRERGHKWSQATVWSVEKGERPLRLAEAKDLLEILNTGSDADGIFQLGDLLGGSFALSLRHALRRVASAHEKFQAAFGVYMAQLERLAIAAKAPRRKDDPELTEADHAAVDYWLHQEEQLESMADVLVRRPPSQVRGEDMTIRQEVWSGEHSEAP